jgi:aminomethyltransferase
MTMLRITPFHSRTAPLSQAQSWRRWSGYVAASAYELTHDREYSAIRNAAALFDVTPLQKYHVTGRDAVRFLDRVVTRNVARCALHQVMYTPWCDAHGKVIDDGTIARLDERTFRLTAAEPNIRWLRENAVGFDVAIDDVSDAIAALSIQGPTSRAILAELCDGDVSALKFFRLMHTRARGIPVTISRTGYTGDLGYELWTENRHAEALWDALLERGTPHGLTPSGLLALDVARIEAGLILLDVDYVSAHHAAIDAQTSSPYELGLGWTVSLDKEGFVGERALREEKEKGSSWQLVGLDVDWETLERLYAAVGLPPKLPTVAWRVSVPVYDGARQVGYATSGCWSPLLKKYIALAHVEAAQAKLGSALGFEVTVEHRRRRAVARVVKTPFFDPPRKRA